MKIAGRVVETLRHPVESFRTAPIPFTGTAFTVGLGILMTHTAMEVDGSAEIMGLGVSAASALLALEGLRLAAESLDLRQRLEGIIEENGFSERAFSTTTSEWCTRQAARVACEQYGLLDQYENLCEHSAADDKFTWLPHI